MRALRDLTTLSFFFIASQALAMSFGSSGYDGRSGPDGRDGRDGQSVTVTAQGQAQALDLSGSDGTPGSAGGDGEDARFCSPPYHPAYNLEGARGGDGGYGGDGGRGGDGGDLTVYYKDTAALAKIAVNATPGRGSFGGSAGRGGRGCTCFDRAWSYQTCQDVRLPDGNVRRECSTQSYYCYDGRDGMSGSSGSNGREGYWGEIALVPQLTALVPDVRRGTLKVADIGSAHPVLAENLWETRAGARTLFAANSRIADTFDYFTGRKSYPVSFGWEARRAASEFSSMDLALNLGSHQVSLEVDEDMWYQARREMQGDTTHFVFEKALLAKEAAQLEPELRGNGDSLVLVLKDKAQVSDLVDTSLDMKLEADTLFDRNLFVGVVPAQYLTIKDDSVEVALGQMPDIDHKYFKSGKKLLFKIDAKRSLGSRSATQELKFNSKIP